MYKCIADLTYRIRPPKLEERPPPIDEPPPLFFARTLVWSDEAKTFQKRSVSSAAAEATVAPSGLCSMWRTRAVWPLNSWILVMVGYLQSMS